jgi:hypothetical protein
MADDDNPIQVFFADSNKLRGVRKPSETPSQVQSSRADLADLLGRYTGPDSDDESDDSSSDEKGPALSPASIAGYVALIGRLREIYCHLNDVSIKPGDHRWMFKADRVFECLAKWSIDLPDRVDLANRKLVDLSLNSRKKVYQALLVATRCIPGDKSKAAKERYRRRSIVTTQMSRDQRIAQVPHKNDFDWPKVTEKANGVVKTLVGAISGHLNGPNKTCSYETKRLLQEALLMGVYTMLVPQVPGRNEARLLQTKGYDPSRDNYVRKDASGKWTVTYKRFKTDQANEFKNGLVFRVQDDLGRALDLFQRHSGAKFLFENANGQVMPSAAFAQFVSRTFEKHIAVKGITSQSLRRSFATWFAATDPTLEQTRSAAFAMGHSLETHQQYVRIALDDPRRDQHPDFVGAVASSSNKKGGKTRSKKVKTFPEETDED